MLKQALLLDSNNDLFPTQHQSLAWTIFNLFARLYSQECIRVEFDDPKGGFVLKMPDLLLGLDELNS